jgi:Na+/H+ antiporter NhaD/arsenite permease-like protein
MQLQKYLNLTLFGLLASLPLSAQASSLNGAALGLAWCLPFACILLSIAVFPMLAEAFWHHHFGKIVAGLTLAFLLPFAGYAGLSGAFQLVLHALLSEYLPFVILLLCLYTLSGGIVLSGRLHASPALNTGILALGSLLAPLMGTTGAAMLLIRPLLRANKSRHYKQHVVVFFIFLVANIGGGLTPLGDPPLFLGFLKGVTFGWTFSKMLLPVLTAEALLLLVFYVLDRHYFRKEAKSTHPARDLPLRLSGSINFLLLLLAVGGVLLSGIWQPGWRVDVLGVAIEVQNLVRDLLLLLLTGLSLWLTPRALRAENEFNWLPMAEVAKLFAAIFITIVPVIEILRAGPQGALASVVHLVTLPSGQPSDVMYFWITGTLSSMLDNAPTYLVFFNLASGDAQTMMGSMSSTLQAISMGAVFMGALTYIGNAPNLMVKNIAHHHRVKMPGFFGYMLWSCAILLPLFLIESLLFL